MSLVEFRDCPPNLQLISPWRRTNSCQMMWKCPVKDRSFLHRSLGWWPSNSTGWLCTCERDLVRFIWQFVSFLISFKLMYLSLHLEVTALRWDGAQCIWWHSHTSLDDMVAESSTLMVSWSSYRSLVHGWGLVRHHRIFVVRNVTSSNHGLFPYRLSNPLYQFTVSLRVEKTKQASHLQTKVSQVLCDLKI